MQINRIPSNIRPMLARLTREPFDSPDHIFELKWEGIRALAFIEGGKFRLPGRNLLNMNLQPSGYRDHRRMACRTPAPF